jgi:hypothetical protein
MLEIRKGRLGLPLLVRAAAVLALALLYVGTTFPRGTAPPTPYAREVAGLFVDLNFNGVEWADRLLDARGRALHRFDHWVLDGVRLGEDRVFLTDRSMVRLSPGGSVVWTIPLWAGPHPDGNWGAASGELQKLPGGDLLAVAYQPFSDSGANVLRLDPASGRVVWRASCDPLHVQHSAYRQTVVVAVVEGQVKVTSGGSSGTFVELLDLGSGRQLGRGQRMRH